jgi:hypothetical protein
MATYIENLSFLTYNEIWTYDLNANLILIDLRLSWYNVHNSFDTCMVFWYVNLVGR